MTERLKIQADRAKRSPNFNDYLAGNITFNELLIIGYKAETGCSQFHTFKQWKERGFSVLKGSKGFPIFSRPISVIKAEQGKEVNEEQSKLFGTCYLFNESQVEKK